jgi:hypothetical protein
LKIASKSRNSFFAERNFGDRNGLFGVWEAEEGMSGEKKMAEGGDRDGVGGGKRVWRG